MTEAPVGEGELRPEHEDPVIIGIFGSHLLETITTECEAVAKAIVAVAQHTPLILYTGMSRGIPEEVFRRVIELRDANDSELNSGQIQFVGWSPWENEEEHLRHGDPLDHVDKVSYLSGNFADPHARFGANSDRMARKIDGAIVFEGGAGTKSELVNSLENGKPVVLIGEGAVEMYNGVETGEPNGLVYFEGKPHALLLSMIKQVTMLQLEALSDQKISSDPLGHAII